MLLASKEVDGATGKMVSILLVILGKTGNTHTNFRIRRKQILCSLLPPLPQKKAPHRHRVLYSSKREGVCVSVQRKLGTTNKSVDVSFSASRFGSR